MRTQTRNEALSSRLIAIVGQGVTEVRLGVVLRFCQRVWCFIIGCSEEKEG